MSWDQMNPEYITKTGYIKMTDEAPHPAGLPDGARLRAEQWPQRGFPGDARQIWRQHLGIGFGKRLSLTFNGVLLAPTTPSGAHHDHRFSAKPWNEGSTFTQRHHGVTYTYEGGKWLASGGPKVDGEFVRK